MIDWYIATGEWRERAGGYAIQGRGAALVPGIEGDYLNVVGLSVADLLDLKPNLLAGPAWLTSVVCGHFRRATPAAAGFSAAGVRYTATARLRFPLSGLTPRTSRASRISPTMGIFSYLTGFGGRDMAVDLGTANTLVYVRGRGIVLSEPSVVAIDSRTGEVHAVGIEAKRMLGRTPGHDLGDPPAEGRRDRRLRRHGGDAAPLHPEGPPEPLGASARRRLRALRRHRRGEARGRGGLPLGRRAPGLPDRGADGGRDRRRACRSASRPGSMVVDIGGGTSEVAVISLGGIVVSQSIRVGGDELDEAIINYAKREYKLLIGQQTAEEVKLEIGSAYPMAEEVQAEIRGRDMVSGLPKTVVLTSEEIRQALEEPLSQIIDAVKETLDRTPPELASDIMDRGIMLAGGGSLLQGLDERLREETQMPAHLAESPLTCVAVGSGRSLEEFEVIHRTNKNSKQPPAPLLARRGQTRLEETLSVYDKTVRRRRAVLGLLVALSLILLTAYFGESAGGGLHAVQRGVLQVLAPIQEGASRALKPFRDLAGWFGDTLHAQGQRDKLRKERNQLRREVIGAQAARRENQQLQRLLGIDQSSELQSYTPVTARVIGRSPTGLVRDDQRRSRLVRRRARRPAGRQRRRARRQGHRRHGRRLPGHADHRPHQRRLGEGAHLRRRRRAASPASCSPPSATPTTCCWTSSIAAQSSCRATAS